MLDEIRRIYRAEAEKGDKGHPRKALWRWAEAGKTSRDKAERYEALSEFARKKEREADEKTVRELWDSASHVYRDKMRHFDEVADEQAEKRARDKSDTGVTTFDGKPVSAEWAPILAACRRTGLWHGGLNSGYRTPAYSTQLCINICGQPVCPGRCAGAGSNHSKLKIIENSAVDVSDPAGFRAALVKIGRGDLHNALGAADPWHFSRSGR